MIVSCKYSGCNVIRDTGKIDVGARKLEVSGGRRLDLSATHVSLKVQTRCAVVPMQGPQETVQQQSDRLDCKSFDCEMLASAERIKEPPRVQGDDVIVCKAARKN